MLSLLHSGKSASKASADSPRQSRGTQLLRRKTSSLTLSIPNPLEDACLGCASQRKTPPNVREKMHQLARSLSVDEFLFEDLLGKWKPSARDSPFWEGRLDGHIDIFGNNVIHGKLVSTIGMTAFAMTNFEGTGSWNVKKGGSSGSRRAIELQWDPDISAIYQDDEDGKADLASMTYDVTSKQLIWGKLSFTKRGAFEGHLVGSDLDESPTWKRLGPKQVRFK